MWSDDFSSSDHFLATFKAESGQTMKNRQTISIPKAKQEIAVL
jgi:hypothetical protein